MKRLIALLVGGSIAFLCACDGWEVVDSPEPPAQADEPTAPPEPQVRDARPPPMAEPVPLYENGTTEREIDAATARTDGYLVLDLGESWTPYLFTERSRTDEERVEHRYRDTYLALSRGEFPSDYHGRRARRDRYLELYGIMPTLSVLRERFRAVRDLDCRQDLDLDPLVEFDGFVAYRSNPVARRRASHFRVLENRVETILRDAGVDTVEELDEATLGDRDQRFVEEYESARPRAEAIRAAQARLECEGYFDERRSPITGAMDWVTHEALAEFERRHRVYGWGYIGRDTLERLRQTPLELEREAVLRVLTERAMHSLGVIEDGTAPGRDDEPATYPTREGSRSALPNFERTLRERIERHLGLVDAERTLAFLEGLGELRPGERRLVAVRAPELPDYYTADMDIRITIDRGDVWYEFPYDDEGRERAQPVARRPRLSVVVESEGRSIVLARFGTTVGGWRSESIDGRLFWRYKNSPTGPRIWNRISAAPVWMPPESTPARDLISRGRGGDYTLNRHEIGPSYASAYGLVAAYHQRFRENEDGTLEERGDEGIRTHGSVDYMSIMRRHSHGCHRLHNHIAVRLMSWVLAHRPHRRVGHRAVGFRRDLEHDGQEIELEVEYGGYDFELSRPVPVQVLTGRVRGSVSEPIDFALPQYDSEAGAYFNAEGSPVRISRAGVLTPYELPQETEEVPPGAVDLPPSPFALPPAPPVPSTP